MTDIPSFLCNARKKGKCFNCLAMTTIFIYLILLMDTLLKADLELLATTHSLCCIPTLKGLMDKGSGVMQTSPKSQLQVLQRYVPCILIGWINFLLCALLLEDPLARNIKIHWHIKIMPFELSLNYRHIFFVMYNVRETCLNLEWEFFPYIISINWISEQKNQEENIITLYSFSW